MAADLPKDMTFDLRILERNVRKGVTTRKDVEKHVQSLTDRTDQSALIEARMEARGHEPPKVAAISAARKREQEEELD